MEKSFWERSQRAAKKRRNKKGMAVGIITVILVCLVIFRACQGTQSNGELLSNKDTFYKGIYVEDISLEGMTVEEAKAVVLEKLEEKCAWSMQVVYGADIVEIEDLLSCNIETILKEAFLLGRIGTEQEKIAEIKKIAKVPVKYTIEKQYESKKIENIINEVAKTFDVKAINADLTGYNQETKEFMYSEAVEGFELDQEDLRQQIIHALEEKKYDAKLSAKINRVVPKMDKATVKEKVQLMGSFQTTTTQNSDRNENIRIASAAISGMILKPKQEFSMNKTTGPRSEKEGYKRAGTISNGQLVEEPGGGVCQVSTTLYNAVVKAGIETTKRFSHSLEPTYVTPGEDAMISYPGNDFKFVNNGSSSMVILIRFYDNQLSASIYGIPILEEGVTVEMESETASVIPIPKPTYEEDASLAYGEQVVVSEGREGKKVVTYLVTKKDGVEISRELFHNSTYQAKKPIIKRNSKAEKPKATQEPTPSPSPNGEPTDAPGSTIVPTITPDIEEDMEEDV